MADPAGIPDLPEDTHNREPREAMSRPVRLAMMIAAGVSVVLGLVGIFVPLLPTTPFLLLAAFLFARSSPALNRRLHDHPVTGPYLKAYTDGEGMSLRRKITTVALLWLTLAISAYLTRERWWIPAILAVVGIGVSTHIIVFPGKRR